ncbi:hypothetical protein G6F29_004330 [Rhizopus arrhizus]|nr:hypothetical protein G6F24_002446 [Rhizopus arrhizus]KAG1419592.1 hypothetical protein G6F58_004534 [Rhizopus delemar]KAG0842918.1 hypothetical protein G6F19_000799 [Rhizopus arrhizus]KAG0900120.1 hypothetical protein G6F34_004128 [Rhizopus arrhizus]KAG0917752.1 hypothetical protein G6F33_001208 [Rhizopus arrhizus]
MNGGHHYAATTLTSLVSSKSGQEEFVVYSDSPCKLAIEAMPSTKLGLCVINVDNPQLNMHSIRKTGNMDDVEHGTDLLRNKRFTVD